MNAAANTPVQWAWAARHLAESTPSAATTLSGATPLKWTMCAEIAAYTASEDHGSEDIVDSAVEVHGPAHAQHAACSSEFDSRFTICDLRAPPQLAPRPAPAAVGNRQYRPLRLSTFNHQLIPRYEWK